MTAIAIIGAMDEEVANIATALSNVTVTEAGRARLAVGITEEGQ